ncbi:DUF262 domain-containing protein [Bifidobacterium subtile]|jgi:hypothetical protein|uniref:DUF262 domain-containing protein n=1 Tax=Bifidobacterium subtile TaxID=77635 RepID=A0A087EBM8_9BIFI|nr:DUF262 domain-containing protein [Bifidobacterium subtile]KFJ05179.1 hypothetical protein BISU_1296 [Bifidobacterium subtile]QOL36581.1 DUF262 domain-containing protein [Bifidobacterium subtile]
MATTRQPLKAAEIPLGKLFSNDFDFVIPEYQRPYTWGTDETMQLLSDLQSALERDTDEPYFLGSVVLVKEEGDTKSEVIDGQQRLTTLSLILGVLRDLVDNPNMSRAIHEFLEKPAVEWDDDQPATPRLALRPRDKRFFNEYVQTVDGTAQLVDISNNVTETDSQRAIRDNAKALRAELEGWDQEQLKALFKMMGARTFMVTVSTPDLNSAYRIFSVMNSRGMPLAPSDIFKSQVIGAIPDSDKQHYADLWEKLEEDLGRDEFANLFLYIRAVSSQTRAVRSLLTEFPEQVLNKYLLADDGKGFIKEVLEPYARADVRLNSADFAGADWAGVNAWLKRLGQLDNDDWRPVALWALKHHGDDPVFLEAFLQKLERLAASMLLRRLYATPRAQRYMELLSQLVEGTGIDSPAFELSDREKEESIHTLDGELYTYTRIRKYVLLRLDSALANDPGASYDHNLITVEHVLPQTPSEGSDWLQDFTEDEREYWTHRLGNLLLLNRRKNSQAQNYDFEKKKEAYFTSNSGVAVFALTTQVLQEPVWTPEVIERRQADLKALLIKEWQLS